MNKIVLSLLLLSVPGLAPAAGTPPRIATDIAPVQALVTAVTGNDDNMTRIISADASPHHHSLRLSKARGLSQAYVVFRIGDEHTPWIGEAMTNLAPDALDLPLLSLPDTRRLDNNPHAWLSPDNAIAWLEVISATLGDLDPEKRDEYSRNARRAVSEINNATDRIHTMSLKDRRWLICHDILGYFSEHFNLPAVDVISGADESPPSVSHLATVRQRIASGEVDCLLAEATVSPRDLAALERTGKLGVIQVDPIQVDPLGRDLATDNNSYTALLSGVATAIEQCGTTLVH